MKRNLLALILLGQALDAMTFLIFYRVAPPIVGPTEKNWLIVAVMAAGGMAGVALLKVGLGWITCVVGTYGIPSPGFWRQAKVQMAQRIPGWLLWLGRRTRPYRLALGNVLLVGATVSGFIGTAFNSAAIWRVLS